MFTTYRRVLALPGALVFSMSGLVARLPISMVSLGIVLLVSTRTGSYSLAGAVSASYLIASALFAVLQARLIDRLGQSRVLPVCVVVFAVAMSGLMTTVELDVRAPWPHLCAAAVRCRDAADRLVHPGPLVAPGAGQGRPAHRLRLRGGRRRDGVHPRAGAGHRAGHHASTRWPA